MPLPIENAIAAFPPSVKAGNVTLRPLSIGSWIRLAEIGIDVMKTPVPKDKLFSAAFVLSGEAESLPLHSREFNVRYRRFLRRFKSGLKELSNAVEEILNASFSTHIPPMQDKDAPAQLTPSGLGWPLVLAEWLCAEYGWTFEHAIDIPLPRVFALQAAARVRHGGKHGGPDYVERTLDIVKNSRSH